ncbi:NADP-dependent oxidoreductase [Embleya sp. NBC_00896]|uniref:NADP-dependent oxidoreductase n=1 Tax=Embleya sp. NBC_00896 TaxID=2975961 RepID=UPI002F90FF32|nr:NADP-dependent oxidoreductase [Embleya sp. NBC_00896]
MSKATMRAVRIHEFGGPEVLVYEEVPRPEPKPDEVLIRIHAACLNPPDWYARIGFANIPADKRPDRRLPFTPGSDASGVVVAVGSEVTEWAEGDAVFGMIRFPDPDLDGDTGGRTYAEYTTAPAAHLARKPAGIDHIRAAAVPMAGLTAYQFLFDHVRLEPGRTVLVNGAAGGVGHFLVQLAKSRGAHVIGVASGRHESFLRGLGVDRFIDYTTTAPADAVRDVDHLFDTVGGPDGGRFLPVVKRGGTISPVFFGDYDRERAAESGITFKSGQVHSDGGQLAELAHLIDAGAVRVGIDGVFALADAHKAHERAAAGHIQGKIVLRVVEEG